MKGFYSIICLVLVALVIPSNTSAGVPDWPDTTLVSWDGIDNRVCWEDLVWCLLEPTTTFSQCSTLVESRSGTIWDWHDNDLAYFKVCIVEIPSSTELGLS